MVEEEPSIQLEVPPLLLGEQEFPTALKLLSLIQEVQSIDATGASSLEFTPPEEILPREVSHDLVVGGEDTPPSPSIAFATEITNGSTLTWECCDSMPSACVKFYHDTIGDGDLLEICDE
ncbi:hypothetical protein Dimus_020285, partial [Dionaea muscipula]